MCVEKNKDAWTGCTQWIGQRDRQEKSRRRSCDRQLIASQLSRCRNSGLLLSAGGWWRIVWLGLWAEKGWLLSWLSKYLILIFMCDWFLTADSFTVKLSCFLGFFHQHTRTSHGDGVKKKVSCLCLQPASAAGYVWQPVQHCGWAEGVHRATPQGIWPSRPLLEGSDLHGWLGFDISVSSYLLFIPLLGSDSECLSEACTLGSLYWHVWVGGLLGWLFRWLGWCC